MYRILWFSWNYLSLQYSSVRLSDTHYNLYLDNLLVGTFIVQARHLGTHFIIFLIDDCQLMRTGSDLINKTEDTGLVIVTG